MNNSEHTLDVGARLALATRLVRTAGAEALRFYHHPESLQVQRKGGQDWVSDADTAVEALLVDSILAAFPHDQILGEESGVSGTTDQATGMHWVIDPIDGTTCFLSRIPQWCIAIALCSNQDTLASVIYDPLQDELYSAQRGSGAWLNHTSLKLDPDAGLKDGLLSVGSSPALGAARAARYMERLLQDGGLYTRIGSTALGLAYVASGRLIGLIEPRVHPWDSWGASLLVAEAGGCTLAPESGPTLSRPGPAMAATPRAWEHICQYY